MRGWEGANPSTSGRRDNFRMVEHWEVVSANGRQLWDKEVFKAKPGEAFSYAGRRRIRSTNALNWPIQSSGAELLKHCLGLLMPRLWEAFGGAVRVAHLIHDEILLVAPEVMAEQAAEVLKATMEDPELATTYLGGLVPLVAEVSVGRTWAETH